jgi:predicted regulator of Ras-like GTPase activity (Roadblock/LC7/MglB family)
VPFRSILLELLQSIHGSLGALLLDWEGESVEAVTERPFDADDHDLKVIGAYQGIFLTRLKNLCDDIAIGTPHRFKIDFAGTTVMSSDLKDGYYVVLIVEPATNEGVAWRELERCREKLLEEI